MTEVVKERRSLEDAKTRSYIEWQTRALASFIASNSMSEKGAQELHKAAQSLSIIPEEPDNSIASPAAEPAVGSFEKLTGLFGR